MHVLVPNYYHQFRCIAEKCTHSCCIGWEIDIDDATMAFYRSLKGKIGDKIRENIAEEGEPHFMLKEDERCPFLNESGLCDIILEMGEDALCGICADHPRFRNFYDSFIEMGIGLCCEEAARIVLEFEEPFGLVPLDEVSDAECTEEEAYYLHLRNQLLGMLQDRRFCIAERFSALAKRFGFRFNGFFLQELCQRYLALERLDPNWTELLENINVFDFDLKIFEEERFQLPFEQLACYFLFRHFTEARWNGDVLPRIKFMLSGCYLIGALCAWHSYRYGDVSVIQMAGYARMYSSEVEYSQENMDSLLKI